MKRTINFAHAILEATDQCLRKDPRVYVLGLGVADPKGVFGTTQGLIDKYGNNRVIDMPVAENGMTGIAIGSAISGMRPIMVHQRIDFILLTLDQIVNNAAKWHYMFGGQSSVPFVIRLLIGRGWGQGPQHSQSLQSLFTHIPGLKVVMPSTPYNAKGLLVSAIEDNNPVIFIEHRWLHSIKGAVPTAVYRVPIGKARLVTSGNDLTIIASSFMVLEAMRAADYLNQYGINTEIVDLQTLKPLDEESVLKSVRKTRRVIIVDHAWRMNGFAAEIMAIIVEKLYGLLRCKPVRITLPDVPTPTCKELTNAFYPRAIDIVNKGLNMFGYEPIDDEAMYGPDKTLLDVPDTTFTGPF